jgi:hypothetical protein
VRRFIGDEDTPSSLFRALTPLDHTQAATYGRGVLGVYHLAIWRNCHQTEDFHHAMFKTR